MPSRDRRAVAGEYKMVVVVRGELRLTAGKAAVQVAHAAILLYERAEARGAPQLRAWREQGQKKIALTVPTLDELEAIDRAARARGLPTAWVEDAGLTEVAPGTRTCLGLGPALTSELDPVTGNLDLL
jgi:peptidyl-tRNA hydrolase, PTH2 family